MNEDHSLNDAFLAEKLRKWSRQFLGIPLKETQIRSISVSTPHGMYHEITIGQLTIEDVRVLHIFESMDSLHYLVFGENRGHKGGVPFVFPKEWITKVIEVNSTSQ